VELRNLVHESCTLHVLRMAHAAHNRAFTALSAFMVRDAVICLPPCPLWHSPTNSTLSANNNAAGAVTHD
jgi:hypothetical protein